MVGEQLDQKNSSQVKGHGKRLWIEGYWGGGVCTSSKLLGQLKVLEEMIATTDAEVINATEGGARINGTSQMTLKEVMERYCDRTYGFLILSPRFRQRKADLILIGFLVS